MKKISILALHLGYGGIEKCITSLANILCNDYEVEIAVSYKLYEKSAFDLNDKVKVIYLNDDSIIPNREKLKNAFRSINPISMCKEIFFALKVLYYRRKSMIDYLKTCHSDVIISTRDIFNEWTSAYARDDILKIGWEHNHFHDNYKYANRIVNSSRNLDYLVLVSSELQKFYSEKMLNSKCLCIYIPNCIDSIPPKVSSLSEKRLISVGRLSSEKGYIDLLKTFNLINGVYSDWHLDIIGDGNERRKMEEFISSHNLEKSVTLHGFQNKEYIDKMLHSSSIYLMTSHTESFGIVLIEAMSHGVPCIAMDSAEGAREIIKSGYNGYLIRNRNNDAMAKKIEDLIENKKERIKLGKNARESVTKYTSDVVKNEWLTLIEESGVYE